MRVNLAAVSAAVITVLSVPAGAEQGPLSPDDAIVLRAVFDLWGACKAHPKGVEVVVTSPIAPDPFGGHLPQSLSTVEQDAKRRFQAGTALPRLACPGVRWESYDDVKAALNDRTREPDFAHWGWEGFYARFPKSTGVTYLSVPGYSEDGRIALVYLSNSAGLMAGSSWWLEFKKVSGRWRWVKSHPVSVS